MKDKYYDSMAKGYDELYGREQANKMRIIKKLIKVTPRTKILDLGCGTGISCDFDCEVVGIDPSEELIKIAKAKDKDSRHMYMIRKAEDIGKLGFEDKVFDYVICVSSVHHFEELDKIFEEVKRVGKSFVVTVLGKSSRKREIIKTIRKKFRVHKKIQESKDEILYCYTK